MVIRLFIAIVTAFLLTALGHLYLYERLIVPLAKENSPLFAPLLIFLWGSTFFGFLILRIIPQLFRKLFEIIMFVWMGVAFVFLTLCIVTLPINIILNIFQINPIYLSVIVIIIGSCLVIYGVFNALRPAIIMPIQIPIPNDLPDSLCHLKCVVIGDIHVSGLIGRRRMRHLCKTINALLPDLILITGDLMDGSIRQLKKDIEPLKDLKAKEGIVYITGNHEYYSGPTKWKTFFQNKFAWTVLSNSSATLELSDGGCLNILGIEDKHELNYEKIPKKYDKRVQIAVNHLEELGVNKEKSLNILLAHQPKDAKFLVDFPWIHLQISGHTHGGQIWPLKYFVLRDQKYNAGLYKNHLNQYIYVNQGTGFWGPPMRLGSHSEITLLGFKKNKIE